MAKYRRRSSAFENWIDLASKLPWWLSLALAVVSYFLLHAYATSPIDPIQPGSSSLTPSIYAGIFHGLAMAGQFVLPIVFVVGAIFALIQRFKDRSGKASVSPSDDTPATPACPVCGSTMVQRRARRGSHTGDTFWGCKRYPSCKGNRPVM